MSDTLSERKDAATGDPEGEWDTVVKRISERIKKKPGVASSTQSSLDLAGELVRLERRAVDAEATLERERDAYAVRVHDMEDKLRKLEPWLRQLKGEYGRAAAERDKLRDELKQVSAVAGTQTSGPSAADMARMSVLQSEREAALNEAEAARAERDVAVAEAEALKRRMESEKSNLQSSWHERIATAEKARDQALEDLKQMRKAAGETRRFEDEVKRLLKQIEQLETTTSAHRAVARAAQEEVETLKARVVDLEKAGQKKSESVQKEGQRAQELGRHLEQARGELSAAQMKLVDAESVVVALRAEHEKLRRDLTDRAQALDAARAELDQSKKTVEKLRAETADARRQADQARVETSQAKTDAVQAKREAEAAAEEAARSRSDADDARSAFQKARDEAAAAAKEAAETREIAEEALRAEDQSRRRADELAEKLTSAEQALGNTSLKVRELDGKSRDLADRLADEQRARADVERRARDLDARALQAELRIPELQSEIELRDGRVRALESDVVNAARSMEEERGSGVRRFEAAETSWRSQMRAAESRFEADLQRERERTREAEELFRMAEDRQARAVVDHETELTRIREGALQYLATKAQEMVSGVQKIVGGEPIVVTPIAGTFDGNDTMPADAAADGASAEPAATGPADWDRLISDVESLWSEVEGMRTDNVEPREETASMSADEAGAVAQALKSGGPQVISPDDLAFDEPVSDGRSPSSGHTVEAEVEDTHTASPGDPSSGKRRRRRR